MCAKCRKDDGGLFIPKPRRTKRSATGLVPESGVELSGAEAACIGVSPVDLKETTKVETQPLTTMDMNIESVHVENAASHPAYIMGIEGSDQCVGLDQSLGFDISEGLYDGDAYHMTIWLLLVGTLSVAVLYKNSSRASPLG